MCGDRCFDDKLFEAAEILFKKIGNHQKLAQVYVMLKKYQMAFDAAKRADVPKVWKEIRLLKGKMCPFSFYSSFDF